MKKLMIAACAVACAAMAQAATIQWNSGTVYYASDKNGTVVANDAYKAKSSSSGHQVKAYLFTLGLEEYTAAQSMTTAALYEKYVLATGTAAITPAGTKTTGSGATANISVPGADGTEVPQTMYGLVIYEDKNTPVTDKYTGVDAFVKTSFATKTWQDNVGGAVNDLAGTGAWTAYSAVPEPTSGLLLLLGVAGLALRRRRA